MASRCNRGITMALLHVFTSFVPFFPTFSLLSSLAVMRWAKTASFRQPAWVSESLNQPSFSGYDGVEQMKAALGGDGAMTHLRLGTKLQPEEILERIQV